MKVYRIIAEKHSEELKASGYAARWNSAGMEVIYTASSAALACLENVVHRDNLELKMRFSLVTIEIDDAVYIKHLKSNDIGRGSDEFTESAYEICRQAGDKWKREGESAVLKVPSVIVKSDFNYLLNMNHPESGKIKIIQIEPFVFDKRIKG
jgi:RES domain-containing protein